MLSDAGIACSSARHADATAVEQVPLWPFLSLSFGVGIFALYPYLCLWQPQSDRDLQSPPAPEELETGFGRFAMRALESRWLPVLNLVGASGLLYYACTAGIPAWNAYFHLFDESKFVHVMTLDFCALTVLQPYFMNNDAQKRGWASRGAGVPILSLLPVVGPLIYLLMRPVAQRAPAAAKDDSENGSA
jgi:hypothetical protein